MKSKLKPLLISIFAATLCSSTLAQTPATGSSPEEIKQRLTEKVERIKAGAKKWMESGRDPSAIGKTMEKKFKPLIQSGKVVEAEAVLDGVLAQLSTESTSSPTSTPSSVETVQQRVMAKVQRIKEGAQKMAASGTDPSPILKTMQEKVGPLLHEGKFTEAEPELDRVLEQLTKEKPGTGTSPSTTQSVHERVAAKIERIKEGAQKMAESGTDPSPILKTMGEKVGPLLDAGKFTEAEPELDRVLKLLMPDASPAPEELKAAPQAASPLEQVATGFRLAEGPVWDGANLLFADVFPSKILKYGADGTVSTMRSDTRKGAGMALDSKGRLLICEVDGFRVTRIEKDGTEKTLADSYEGKKLNGPNDLAVDGKDGIYFTDPLFLNKDKRQQDKEAVYYIRPDGKILRVADDLEKPNGIALSKDGQTLYVADTLKARLRAYVVKEDGTLGEGRDFGTVPGPDGVRVDVDGRVYAAGKTGIAVWDAAGKSLGMLKTPTAPNSLAFGGPDLRTMFITTNPSVFKIRVDQVLKLLASDEPATTPTTKPVAETSPASTQTVHQRVAAKIERIKEGAQKMADGGTDPSPILNAMKEKAGPLLDAGKFTEAEPELDRALEQLTKEAK
jgi:gluconolactonase